MTSTKDWITHLNWTDSWAPLPKRQEIFSEIPHFIVPQKSQTSSEHVQKEDLAFFETKGYWQTKNPLLSPEQISHLRKALFAIYRGQIDTTSAQYYEYTDTIKILEKADAAGLGPMSSLQQQKLHDDIRSKSDSGPVMKINNSWWISESIRSLLNTKWNKLLLGGGRSKATKEDEEKEEGEGETFGEAVGRIAADLLGVNEICLWHDQVICKCASKKKPATTGKKEKEEEEENEKKKKKKEEFENVIGWHRDHDYWQCCSPKNQEQHRPKMITALVMLQETSPENGCLKTIEGTHLIPRMNQEEEKEKEKQKEQKEEKEEVGKDAGFFSHDLEGLQKQWLSRLPKEQREKFEWKCIDNVVEKTGCVTFHDSLTLHGSGPNFDFENKRPRLAIAIHMYAPEECVYKSSFAHHNVRDLGPFLREGDEIRAPTLPVLFKRK